MSISRSDFERQLSDCTSAGNVSVALSQNLLANKQFTQADMYQAENDSYQFFHKVEMHIVNFKSEYYSSGVFLMVSIICISRVLQHEAYVVIKLRMAAVNMIAFYIIFLLNHHVSLYE